MGYNKIRGFCGAEGKKFGRYFVGYTVEPHFDFRTNDVLFTSHEGYIATRESLVFRSVLFDLENRNILFDVKLPNRKCFRKRGLRGVTNKEFFDYVRKNMEKLFLNYIVIPNKDRTKFKLIKNYN